MDLKLSIPIPLVILSCFVIYGSSLHCFTQSCQDDDCITKLSMKCTEFEADETTRFLEQLRVHPPTSPANPSQFQCARYEITHSYWSGVNNNMTAQKFLVAGCVFDNFLLCDDTTKPLPSVTVHKCIRCNHMDNCNSASMATTSFGAIVAPSIFMFVKNYF